MMNVPGLNNYEIYSEASHGPNGSATRIQIQQGALLQQQEPQQRMNQMGAMQQNNNTNTREKIYSSERPALPPPPVPAQNHLSDLQQIQQQMTRKKNSDYNGTNGHLNYNKNSENGHGMHENNGNSNDLPPPPSPPHMDIHLMNGKLFVWTKKLKIFFF